MPIGIAHRHCREGALEQGLPRGVGVSAATQGPQLHHQRHRSGRWPLQQPEAGGPGASTLLGATRCMIKRELHFPLVADAPGSRNGLEPERSGRGIPGGSPKED